MCFCFVLGYVCELFSELVGFLFGKRSLFWSTQLNNEYQIGAHW